MPASSRGRRSRSGQVPVVHPWPVWAMYATGVAGLAVSRDAGRTWQVRTPPPGVVEALSTVVTTSGTTFVSTGTGRLLRARPGRGIEVVPGLRPVSLRSTGDRLFALTARGRDFVRPVLHVSGDGGRTWSRVPPPGRGG